MVQYVCMNSKNYETIGWGKVDGKDVEFWDARPIFTGESVDFWDRVKLIFFPKKFLLYRYITKALGHFSTKAHKIKEFQLFRILDVGCGTGASVIEMKKLWGKRVEVVGVDVIPLQIDIARERVKEHGVWAAFHLVYGELLPFKNESFDVVYTSDVLGHVENVPMWLGELNRVLKPGGVLAMFSESEVGKHAYVRKYLLNRGLNTDPHAQFHISLYSKQELKKLLNESGFKIKRMYSTFWAKFLVHPDELYDALQGQKKFLLLRVLNKMLYWIKKVTHPVSTAVVELYGLIEMLTIGRWVEAQGYVVLARKLKIKNCKL